MAFQLGQRWTMQSSDMCVVGGELGIEWNTVCKAIRDEDFYGQEDGGVLVERDDIADWEDGIIKTIFEHIFATHPHVDEISVMN